MVSIIPQTLILRPHLELPYLILKLLLLQLQILAMQTVSGSEALLHIELMELHSSQTSDSEYHNPTSYRQALHSSSFQLLNFILGYCCSEGPHPLHPITIFFMVIDAMVAVVGS
ncbi:hypothetical protein Tco_0090382 [Tanacetum coccineum]